MLGNEAVARAAYEAGVTVATAYPGTPSTEITECAAKYGEIYCEWAPNEKVALEVAIGASIAGARAMCAMKHVGLNVAADPLFTASYTGVCAGLVVVVADDPGQHSSQNEQDSRYYGLSAKVPVLEPSDSRECLGFVKSAFEISEAYDTPVIVRLTTRVAHSRSLVEVSDRRPFPLKPYAKNMAKYVMMPAMAKRRHIEVEKRMRRLEAYAETTELNSVESRAAGSQTGESCVAGSCAAESRAGESRAAENRVAGSRAEERPAAENQTGESQAGGSVGAARPIGVITSGMSWQYVREAAASSGIGVEILKLGLVHPLPAEKIRSFAAGRERVLVVEELAPFIEDFAKKSGAQAVGKELFPAVGELSARAVAEALAPAKRASPQPAQSGRSQSPNGQDAQLPAEPQPAQSGRAEPQAAERPQPLEQAALPSRPPVLCPGCPHRSVFYVLRKLKLNVCGDIGCYTLGAMPPLDAMDTCICMGASIGVAHGMDKARGPEFAGRTVAVIGDSTFLHSGVTGLMDVVYNKGNSTVLILDNSITGMTGHQQNPGTGYTIRSEETSRVDLEKLCEALGVRRIRTVDPFDVKGLEAAVRAETAQAEPSVIIARRPCALLKTYRPQEAVFIDAGKCARCKRCMAISCAAISDRDGRMEINAALCARCGLCLKMCAFGAIRPCAEAAGADAEGKSEGGRSRE
ncbi:MAG: indolepyruvate ferredoxin oxidoreductase subunit alpha [Clostridiales bacterium]|jgi:indolepyruvate ferredoxin oxidoreductase alpha subunit|nr:indolepyruvate ferredoxin oxidoreductase subunit alpha [Clostridiales bacterium]